MDHNIRFHQNLRESLADPKKYIQLICKLNYLTITRPDITFNVGMLNRYIESPYQFR